MNNSLQEVIDINRLGQKEGFAVGVVASVAFYAAARVGWQLMTTNYKLVKREKKT